MRGLLTTLARAMVRLASPPQDAAAPAEPVSRQAALERYQRALKRGNTQDQNRALHALRDATTAELRAGR